MLQLLFHILVLMTYTADKMCHLGPVVFLPEAEGSGVFILN